MPSSAVSRRLVRLAIQIYESALVEHAKAQNVLATALGLSSWRPPEPLTYTRRASEDFAAGRFDAQYFAPRVLEL
jgi:hypothetical protein